MIQEAIRKVVDNINLTQEEAEQVMNEIMSGIATDIQIGAFLVALRMKGETVEEITGCAKIMRAKAERIDVRNTLDIDRDEINIEKETIVDTCGTGGDRTNTFNISTATALVVAGAGVKVAKHGNRAASSQCGSADVLQELGININLEPKKVEQCIKEIGIGFMYAPLFHNAMKYAIRPRKEVGVRTIFNLLGPLTNPANATCQVMGVYDRKLTEPIAIVLGKLGIRHAFVVCGLETLDEVSITGATQISEFREGIVKTYQVTPEDFEFSRASLQEIKGGDAKENAKIIMEILKGEKSAKRDVVLLNVGFALVAAGKAKNVKEGIKIAMNSIDSGKAMEKLEQLKQWTNK